MQAGNKMTFHNDNFNTCLLETENVWGSSASAWNLFCPGAGAKNKQLKQLSLTKRQLSLTHCIFHYVIKEDILKGENNLIMGLSGYKGSLSYKKKKSCFPIRIQSLI